MKTSQRIAKAALRKRGEKRLANLAGQNKRKKVSAFHRQDDVLIGISYDDLLTTIESNEKTYDERTVQKVFDELLKINLRDARMELKQNMKGILKELNED